MPQFSYPGIYNEERRRIAPIQGVSTSNFGVVGAAERGPEDEATLITSFTQFQETFGDFITDSTLAMQVYAFFAQEGRQAYIVRVCRPDAVAACGYVQNDVQGEIVHDNSAGVAFIRSVGMGLGNNAADLVNVPVGVSRVEFNYMDAAAPVAGEVDYVATAPQIRIAFKLQSPLLGAAGGEIERPGTPVAFGSWNAGVNTCRLATTPAANDIIAIEEVLPGPGNNVIGYLDAQTGWVSLDFGLCALPTNILAGALNAFTSAYQPLQKRTVTDNGLGVLVGDVVPGVNTINYTTGVYEFQCLTTTGRGSHVTAKYIQLDFGFCAKSRGAWGNDLEIRVYGSEEFYTASTGQYSRADIEVWYDDPIEGVLTLKETFTELVLDDPTDANYIVSVINDQFKGSDLITMNAAAAQDQMASGVNANLRKGDAGVWGEAIGAGNGVATVFEAAASLYTGDPIVKRTLAIRYYTVGGVLRTVTDDGEGNLIGDVAGGGVNAVDYATGQIQFTAVGAPIAVVPATPFDGAIRAYYYTDPQCDPYCIDAPVGGTDGVLPITRLQVSSPALEATNRGVYALNVPDEIMTAAIPDFATDPTVTLDLIAWAARKLDKFIVASVPQGATPTQAKDYKRLTLGSYSSFCALYYPFVNIIDPKTDLQVSMAPCGWVAGAYARTANNKTVSKAPAGVEDGALNLVVGLERNLNLDEIGILNKTGVNCLYESAETGRVIWGARTLSRDDFMYIQRRLFFMFVEKSVYKSTWGFVFETISTGMYDRIKNLVEGFLSGLLSLGYFPTGIPSQAYKVICDTSNNTPAIAEQGIVICDVYLAPTTPGEFILFRYQQLTAVAA